MSVEIKVELSKLEHPLIRAPNRDGKVDKLHGEKEETTTTEAPG